MTRWITIHLHHRFSLPSFKSIGIIGFDKGDSMNAKILLTILLLFAMMHGFACTIGVASGSVTNDGRPLMWKSRDVGGSQVVKFNDEGRNDFIGIGSVGSSYFWMGVNEKGFAIGNALSSDLDRPMGNGDLMLYCLARCETLADFEAILDSTNAEGRDTHTNYAVIDAEGGAAMYEVGTTEYWKFDTQDDPNGYIVRANFSFNGEGSSGIERYNRSNAIMEELQADNNINYRSILQIHSRDLSDSQSIPYEIPYLAQYEPGKPWGYVRANQSISNPGNGSTAVFRGVLPYEPAELTVMWALLGQPAGAIAVPVFPVGLPPEETNTDDSSALCERAIELKGMIYDCPGSTLYADSYKLVNNDETGIWEQVFPMEEELFDTFDTYFDSWTSFMPEDQVILEAQQAMATDAYDFLMSVTVDTLMVANFVADDTEPSPSRAVQFTDMTLHGPASYNWDFENDGVYDSQEQNPAHAYGAEGTFSVKMTAYNDGDSVSVVFEDYITVVNHEPVVLTIIPEMQEIYVYPNEEIEFAVEATDEDGDSLFYEWYLDGELYADSTASVQAQFTEMCEYTMQCVISDGFEAAQVNWSIIVSNATDDPSAPEYSWCLTNYPNPFNPSTTVTFSLKHDSRARLEVYDVRGRKVRTLANERYAAGQHQVVWNGTDAHGEEVASGVYLLKLATDEKEIVSKALLVK